MFSIALLATIGDIEVEVRDGKATVKGNRGRGKLVWNGETRDIPAKGL